MSFQLSILKILVGQEDGRASIEVVKQHLAVYYSSGPEWPARMTRIAARAPNLDIFGQKLIDREVGCWIITDKGREVLEGLELLDRSIAQGQPPRPTEQPAADERPTLLSTSAPPIARRGQPRQMLLRTRKRR